MAVARSLSGPRLLLSRRVCRCRSGSGSGSHASIEPLISDVGHASARNGLRRPLSATVGASRGRPFRVEVTHGSS